MVSSSLAAIAGVESRRPNNIRWVFASSARKDEERSETPVSCCPPCVRKGCEAHSPHHVSVTCSAMLRPSLQATMPSLHHSLSRQPFELPPAFRNLLQILTVHFPTSPPLSTPQSPTFPHSLPFLTSLPKHKHIHKPNGAYLTLPRCHSSHKRVSEPAAEGKTPKSSSFKPHCT